VYKSALKPIVFNITIFACLFLVSGICVADNNTYRQIEAESAFFDELKGMHIQDGSGQDVQSLAREASKNAQGQKEKVDSYTKMIWDNLNEKYKDNKSWPDIMPSSIEAMIKEHSGGASDKYSQKHVFIFISSSMPNELIKKYISAVEGNDNFVFVINGLIDNDIRYIKPTMKWVNSLLCDEDGQTCAQSTIDINPNLFEIFEVDEVPSVVYIKDSQALNDCSSENKPSYLKYVGDTDIMYVFDRFIAEYKNDDFLSDIRNQLINKFFK